MEDAPDQEGQLLISQALSGEAMSRRQLIHGAGGLLALSLAGLTGLDAGRRPHPRPRSRLRRPRLAH